MQCKEDIKMVQILKIKKIIRKSTRSKSGVLVIQHQDLYKLVGKEVTVRIEN
jgi:hypothetical protein